MAEGDTLDARQSPGGRKWCRLWQEPNVPPQAGGLNCRCKTTSSQGQCWVWQIEKQKKKQMTYLMPLCFHDYYYCTQTWTQSHKPLILISVCQNETSKCNVLQHTLCFRSSTCHQCVCVCVCLGTSRSRQLCHDISKQTCLTMCWCM